MVDNHGFRGAQLALNVSPSVVTTHVKALEERLGFQLCQRGKGGFNLTDKGRVVTSFLRRSWMGRLMPSNSRSENSGIPSRGSCASGSPPTRSPTITCEL